MNDKPIRKSSAMIWSLGVTLGAAILYGLSVPWIDAYALTHGAYTTPWPVYNAYVAPFRWVQDHTPLRWRGSLDSYERFCWRAVTGK